jgi:uncharacterized protein YjbI with pentapeptide repeats
MSKNFKGKNLSGIDLTKKDFTGSNFYKKNLSGINLL